jgi:hypothetical protein
MRDELRAGDSSRGARFCADAVYNARGGETIVGFTPRCAIDATACGDIGGGDRRWRSASNVVASRFETD